MRRRVACVLRRMLFLVGTLLLILFACSLFYYVQVTWDRTSSVTHFQVDSGAVVVTGFRNMGGNSGVQVTHGFDESGWYWAHNKIALVPVYENHKAVMSFFASAPLWLLAFIFLAWPVTSFIIARRRRRGRGFEVEAKPGAAVPPPS